MSLQTRITSFFKLPAVTSVWLIAACAVCLPGIYKLTSYIDRHRVNQGRLSDVQGKAGFRTGSPFGAVFSELRASVGDTIYMKTEIYLHDGVNYITIQHEDDETTTAENSVSDAGTSVSDTMTTGVAGTNILEHEDVEHMHTIIPGEKEDFRGFVGRLEREVKPWRAQHKEEHADGADLIPWYRVATLADPHNIRCYLMGAWWLASEQGGRKYPQAEQFVREGLSNNPEDFQLYVMLGQMLHLQGKNTEAIREYETAVGLALKMRPPNGDVGPNWTQYQEGDAATAAHMVVLLTRDTQTTAAARALGEGYMRLMPDLWSLRRIVTDLDK